MQPPAESAASWRAHPATSATTRRHTHARTAWLCGQLADENDLRAWILGTQSLIAFWDGGWAEAVDRARDGREIARDGTQLARLASLEARACGRRGDADGALQAIAFAQVARDCDDHCDHPGIFSFPTANQHRCAGDAYLWLGELQSAQAELERALQLYETAEEQISSYAHAAVTRMDLATIHLRTGDLDAARERLLPVLNLAAERRLAGALRRGPEIRDLLAGQPFRTNQIARELDDQLETFCATGAAGILSAPDAG